MAIVVLNKGKYTSKNRYGETYDGEKQMGTLNNWRILTSDSNDILEGSYSLLSSRSITLFHTYGPVKSAINKKTQYAIGPGLVFRSQPDWQALGWTEEQGKEWGKRFQKIVHNYQKRFNFYQKQAVIFKTAKAVGDSLVEFERTDGLLSDLIEVSGDQINPDFAGANYTLGIKHDKRLRRLGVAMIDGTEISFQDAAGNQNIVQFYKKDLARQLRGYPLAYSVINLSRNDDTSTDAITHRHVMESTMVGVAKSNGTNFRKQAGNLEDATNKSKGEPNRTTMQKFGNALKMGVGNIFTVRGDGQEDFEFTDMKTPSNNYGEFKEWILNYVCMALDIPPEVAMGKYSTSFTAHKGALNDFIKSYMMDRKAFENLVMNVVVREIAKDAIMQGFIEAPGFFEGSWMVQQAYLQGMYLGPVPGYINPMVEVKAEKIEVDEGFDLRSNKAAKRENEWDGFFLEWSEEQDKFTEIPSSYADRLFKDETENNTNVSGGNDD